MYCLPSIEKLLGGEMIPDGVGNSHSSLPDLAS